MLVNISEFLQMWLCPSVNDGYTVQGMSQHIGISKRQNIWILFLQCCSKLLSPGRIQFLGADNTVLMGKIPALLEVPSLWNLERWV